MTAENPDFYNNKITRRKALTLLAGGSLAAVYAGYKIKNDAIPRYLPSNLEEWDIVSDEVEAGVVAIYEGVNIRTSPYIPNKTRFRQPDNRLDWGQIDTVNGTQLDRKSAFVVVNPSVVVGQDTTDNRYDGPDWIKLSIGKKGEVSDKPYYINHSQSTRDFVSILGYAGYVDAKSEQKDYIGNVYPLSDQSLQSEDIGRVIVPENLDSMAADIMPRIWSERLRNQFEGKVPQVGELVTNVQVVDLWGNNVPVNVREYPSQEYGNGESVKVVGTLDLGTTIDKVLIPPYDYYHHYFAAVLSEDINGFLVDAQGNTIVPSLGSVYAIATPYLSKV